ncbi:sensor histidine kinase [Streptomyces zingiberis]|uniref:histidine kinase n=1 Tax=Streptomyces zingiberis TaxID=2053010 RepID=A0ABX1BP49_9ACTN|nr:histidine kinase [Streptomyces zingiberis]NJP99491.1 histidine kinase [Streptomyces zingiberis]
MRPVLSRPGGSPSPPLLRWASGAVLLSLAAWADLRTGQYSGSSVLGLLTLSAGATGALCGVLLLTREPRLRAAAGGAVALVSLAGSVAVHLRYQSLAASSAYGAFETVVLLVALAVTVRRGAAVAAVPAALLLAVAVVVRPLSIRAQEGSLTVAFVLFLITVLVAGASLTLRLVEADRRRREREVRLEQRVRLARDLHDYVAHHVTGIVVQAQGARAVAAKRPELIGPALSRIEETGAEALDSMRRMVGGLRLADAEGPALRSGMDEVRDLVTGFSVNGARARLSEHGSTDLLPADTAGVLHRVVMESLTNTRKHARDCRRVEVTVEALPTEVTVEVVNDGSPRGATGDGYGLRGLGERVTAAGGSFRAAPSGGDGWRVWARLPLPDAGGGGA